MRLAIIQLGDTHIKSGNPILERVGEIRRSVRCVVGAADAYMLAYTGDLVFSGSQDEYKIAAEFCDKAKAAFAEDGRTPIEVFIPGNHDLDFRKENDARPILLGSAREQWDDLNFAGATVSQILSAQEPFFEFVEARSRPKALQEEKLFCQLKVCLQGVKVSVRCLNTAWMSTLNEDPGKLRFPVSLIEDSEESGDLSIALLHHPYGWLDPDNARQLRAKLEQTCDVIITGHEHSSLAYSKELKRGQHLQYVEGAALHDPVVPRNGFNVIEVDFDEKSYGVTECVWNGESYVPGDSVCSPFVRNAYRVKNELCNTQEFLRILRDPGTLLQHPAQKKLELRDFFVYPDLIKHNSVFKPTSELGTVDSKDALQFFLKHNQIAVTGEEGTGKTSLGKMLYEDFRSASGLVPILITGPEFDGFKPKDARRAVKRAFIHQYGEENYNRFLGFDPSKKAIIIDDWQGVRYNPRGQSALIAELMKDFGKVICLSTDFIQVEQMADSHNGTHSPFASFEFCTIREFGKRLRGALIERWHSLGREYTLSDHDFLGAVRESEHKINTILGKNFLPSYPLFILTMLQAEDSTAATGSSIGSYGHLYEVLITRRLAEVSKKATELGTKYTYISRIAYDLFSKQQSSVTRGDLNKLHTAYCDEYRINLSAEPTLKQLQQAKILSKEGELYRFRYRACYCYFVAKYFQENLANEGQKLRSELNDIADKVYFEDYANIIIFFVFLTKDNQIIDRIRQNARQIYAEYPPADVTKDVEFVEQLLKGMLPPISFPARSTQENREAFRKQCDEDNQSQALRQLEEGDKIVYRNDLDDFVKVAIAFKNLRIMGQILRNFPGVLKGGPKRELAEESCLLGLRTLKRILSTARENLAQVRTLFADVIKERRAIEDEAELAKAADQAFVWLMRGVAFGVIKKISISVGLEELELTYQEVRDRYGESNLSFRLIDVAIKLDHFKECPEHDLEELRRELPNDSFAFTILRDFVAEYLYLYVCDYRKLQKYGDLFDIQTSNPRFYLNKKTKSA
jgi:hypothetical protein